jgi:hypothetical protein
VSIFHFPFDIDHWSLTRSFTEAQQWLLINHKWKMLTPSPLLPFSLSSVEKEIGVFIHKATAPGDLFAIFQDDFVFAVKPGL